MKTGLFLPGLKYFTIVSLLISGGIIGASSSLFALAAFYLFLSLRFFSGKLTENRDMQTIIVLAFIHVIVLTFTIVMFFTGVRTVLKQLAGMELYQVKSAALYCVLIALVLRELGRFSFMEKNWIYFFPGIIAAATVSIAIFTPAYAIADLLSAVILFLLVFVLCFRKTFALMREIIDRI